MLRASQVVIVVLVAQSCSALVTPWTVARQAPLSTGFSRQECWNGLPFQVALVVKNPPANALDLRDTGSVPGWGGSPGGGHATHSRILSWRIPWAEEPGGRQSTRSQSGTQLKQLSMNVCKMVWKNLDELFGQPNSTRCPFYR